MRLVLRGLVFVFFVAGCPRADVAAAEAPKPIVLPEGCKANFSGPWDHAVDSTFHYDALDDGGSLVLTPRRTPPVIDAGFIPHRFFRDGGALVILPGAPPDAGMFDAGLPSTVELRRTREGFVGAVNVSLPSEDGGTCVASFATTVIDCRDGGLTLKTEKSHEKVACGGASDAGAAMVLHRLIRPVIATSPKGP